jgi:enoyl-CoA hydratase/carnithine racemase
VQVIKRAVDASRPDLAAGLARERQIFLEVSRSDDFAEGFSAFLEKRAPHFTHS